MPLYFFDLDEGGDVTRDDEGRALPDAAAARAHAIHEARELMSGDIRRGKLALGSIIRVRDAANIQVLAVSFADAVTICGSKSDTSKE